MLAGFTSVQGQGKTSLLKVLENSTDYKIIKLQSSRDLLQSMGKTLDEVNSNQKLKMYFQDLLLDQHFENLQKIKTYHTVSFVERTFVDLFVYSAFSLSIFNENSNWIDSYFEKCKDAQKIFDKVFYLEYGIKNIQNDGVRSTNKEFANIIDLIMFDYLEKMSPDWSMIYFESNENRAQQIIKILENK